MIRVGINGFGRIGRAVLRIMSRREDMQVVAINDLYRPQQLAYSLKYDTVMGAFNRSIDWTEGQLIVDGKPIRLTAEEIDGGTIRSERYTGPGRMLPEPLPDRQFAGTLHAERLYTMHAAIVDHGNPVLAVALRETEHVSVNRDRLEKLGLVPGAWLRDLKQKFLTNFLWSLFYAAGAGNFNRFHLSVVTGQFIKSFFTNCNPLPTNCLSKSPVFYLHFVKLLSAI